MKAIHNPLATFPFRACHTPQIIKRKPKNRPVLAAIRVARRKFLFTPQTMARKTRPPSSGNAGTRLNSPRRPLMSARYLATARAGVMFHKQRLQKEKDRCQRKAGERPDNCN
jgi:hypothetical protein